MSIVQGSRLFRLMAAVATLGIAALPSPASAGDSGAVQPSFGLLYVGQGQGMVAAGNDSRFPAAGPGAPFGSAALDGAGTASALTVTTPFNKTRTLASKLSDRVSVFDFGAKCDGTTDDSAAILAAGASARRVIVPDGVTCNAPTVTQAALTGTFIGGGHIATEVNPGTVYQAVNNRGPQFSSVTSSPNPASYGDNCLFGPSCWAKFDYTHTFSAEEYHISGAATLGQPVPPTGVNNAYETMAGASPHNMFFDSSSGWNYSHNSNNGRTGGGIYSNYFQQNGGGDIGVFGAHMFCNGSTPPGDGNTTPGPDGTIINGYTDWLAVPECGFLGATVDAQQPGQYLQLGEYPVEDNGNDVTAIGYVHGYRRTAPTAKINNRWIHELSTCNLGLAYTLPCDAHTELQGSWFLGLSTVGATMSGATVAMSSGQKITLNGSAGTSSYAEGNPPLKWNLGGDWIVDDGSGVDIAQSGATAVRIYNNPNAVNFITMAGAATGNGLSITATGSDAAISMITSDKGGGGVVSISNGSIVERAVSTAGSTGYLNVSAGTSTTALLLQDYSTSNQDLGIAGAGTGLVRLVGAVPGASDSSTAVPDTAVVQAVVKAATTSMTANRYKIANVGGGATIALPVPTGVINQMIVEIQPNAATIPSMTLVMPPTASIADGFIVHFVFTGAITSFLLQGATGQTMLGAPSTASITMPLAFMYDATASEWIPYL